MNHVVVVAVAARTRTGTALAASGVGESGEMFAVICRVSFLPFGHFVAQVKGFRKQLNGNGQLGSELGSGARL